MEQSAERGFSDAALGSFSVEALGLVDSSPPRAFDAITRLALRLFGVPVALVSIVEEDKDRQFFASQQGLPEPWLSERQTPLSHSFCQRVKRTGQPLRVADACADPRFAGHPAIRELNVTSYLGVPISMPGGKVIGALCVSQKVHRCPLHGWKE